MARKTAWAAQRPTRRTSAPRATAAARPRARWKPVVTVALLGLLATAVDPGAAAERRHHHLGLPRPDRLRPPISTARRPAKRSSSVTSIAPTRLCASRNSSTGWMSRSTSGGRPNQNGEVGSTWVACAFSASPRTWVNPVTSIVVVNGSVVRHARQPLVVEGRLEAELDRTSRGSGGSAPPTTPSSRACRGERRPGLREPVRITGGVERQHGDLVHPQVVRMRVLRLVVAVGDDDLRALAADDRDQAAHRLVERGLGERRGVLLASESGMPESR